MIHKFSRYLLTLVALLAMTTGAWADEGELLVTITPDASGNIVYSVADIATLDLGGAEYNSSKGCWRKFGGAAYLTVTAADGINVTKVKFTTNKNDSWEDTDAPYQVQLDGGYALNASGSSIGTGDGIKKIEVFGTKAAGPEVTISDDQTSAEFDMPSYDATLEYQIVRNLASNMTVSVGDGQDGYRIRVKKDGESFVPAEMTLQQMMALYTVHDATEQKDLLFYGDGKVCDISIYAVDDQGQTTGQAIAFTALTPGRYVAVATAPDDSPLYAGQTPQSNIFELFEKHITADPVPAAELVYNGQPQALASEAECEGGEMRYSLDGETWSAQMPTVTDAGTYTLYYKVVTGDDDPDTDYKKIENIVVAKAALKSATLVSATLTYDTFNHLPLTAEVSEVKAGEDGSLTVPADDYTVEGNTQTDKGTYTVTVTAKADSKNFTGSTTVDFSIVDEVIDVDEENVPVIVTADPETKTVTIDKIMKPKSGTTVHIPAEINGYKVTKIAAGAMDGVTGVTDIWMPDTEEPIVVEAGALSADATIHTTLALLDDYALMSGLKPNYEGTKVMTTVTAKNRLWTLGTGCDVILPDGLTASTVQLNNTAEVQTLLIPEQDLNLNALTDTRVVKAYNGVLISGAAGQSYDLVAYSQRIASGTAVNPATIKKDYGANILEPVIEPTDYPANGYYVLKDNEFHKILDNHSLVPAGKAVLHTSANAARVLRIVGDAVTGVDTLNVERGTLNDNSFYDLNGRKLDEMPTKKGVYIQNGKKVVVK